MTITLANTRERVRLRLEDTGATTSWNDDEIDAGLRQALDEFSHRVPQEQTVTLEASEEDTSLKLPAGVRRVVRVVDPRGRVVPPQTIPLRGTAGSEQAWEVWGDRLEFSRRLPAGDVEVRYLGPRAFPESDGDPMPVPEEDLSLLVLGAAVWCLEQRSVAEWKRGALPARYEMVLRRAREEYQAAWRSRERQVRTGRLLGTE